MSLMRASFRIKPSVTPSCRSHGNQLLPSMRQRGIASATIATEQSVHSVGSAHSSGSGTRVMIIGMAAILLIDGLEAFMSCIMITQEAMGTVVGPLLFISLPGDMMCALLTISAEGHLTYSWDWTLSRPSHQSMTGFASRFY
jgi:hypothetical protein